MDSFTWVEVHYGIPRDYVKLATCLFISVALSPVLPLLPNATLRHLLNISMSAFFLLGIMQLYEGTLHLVVAAIVSYLLVYMRIGGRFMPWIVCVLAMAHMLYTHLVRELNHVPLTTIEISAMHMVLVMNITSFAWNCYDGQMRPPEACEELQRRARIVRMPSLLEYFGYCFYFPGVLVGPSTRFVDYKAWVENQLYLPRTAPPPGRLSAATGNIAFAVFALATQALLQDRFAFQRLVDVNDSMWTAPIWRKVLLMQVAGLVMRFRFYGVWCLSDSACILSGLGYSGIDARGHAEWKRCKNVYVLNFEFGHNWKEVVDAWNCNTSVLRCFLADTDTWLRNTVYTRIAGSARPGFAAVLGTFVVSAIWHGIAPGYYIAFVHGAMIQQLARHIRKSVRPIFFADVRRPDPTLSTFRAYSVAQIVYSILSNVCTIMIINYLASSFILLSIEACMTACRSVAWYGHTISVVGLAAFELGLGKVLRPLHQRQVPRSEKGK